jgi:hypothetical protein
VPSSKKMWEKPALKGFASAEEAVAYYSEKGMLDHVAAIKRMSGDLETKPKMTENPRSDKKSL